MFPRAARRLPTAAALLVLAGSLTGGAWAAGPRDTAEPHRPARITRVPSAAGSGTPLTGFALQSTAKVADSAAVVSSPGYPARGWYPAGPRSTVLAALLANGVYPDPFRSTNLQQIPRADFGVPWWYRSDFTVEDTARRTALDFSGVVSAADVYVNGRQVAAAADVTGAYTHHELDITSLVRPGTNTVAFRVRPNDPDKDLTVGWLDWIQPPPDRNMGLVRDVVVRRGGPVALRDAHVVTRLAVPSLTSADLTVRARARNDTGTAVTAEVRGSIGGTAFGRTVSLAAHETKTVTFSPADTPGLHLTDPDVWWPAGMGDQPLYGLDLTATVEGTVSDTAHETFGIRDVQAPLNADGARQYRVNGRPLLVKGAGWSPDAFLRWDPAYTEDRLRYALDLGLNTLRLEGHLEPDEFFEQADRLGLLVLPGWECCGKWEGEVNGSEKGERWSEADYPVAKASMAAEAARLRGHPSVLSFLIGSDFAPDATIEKNYLDALRDADWPTPVVPSASDRPSPALGASGMKMTGPYDWVPPGYWYDKREGGAAGFNSETSAGPSIPTLDSLRRMMTPAELDTLWKDPAARQYHRSPSTVFGTLRIYDDALAGRYGAPTSLTDYVRKAQLAQYENVRAQFEAYGRNAADPDRPATGVVHWMFNSGWTSLHWQLTDRYLDQNGSYFGAKKANEPLHIQYSYDNRSVVVVNNRSAPARDLTARATLFNPDGTQVYDKTVTGVGVNGEGAHGTPLTLPSSVPGLARTYLLRLVLTDADGTEVSRNVYWLSTRADTLDWNGTTWYYTPTTGYADLKGLASMAQVPVSATAATRSSDGTSTTTVTLRHSGPGTTPALLTDVHLVDAQGKPVLPVRWSDNEVSLWPGESVTLTATYRTAGLHGSAPGVRVSGWNTPERTVPAA
ncbi:beta-mannosidase [Streptomyces capoamus]|uniref:Beta-mannosidase n=1 Tax=Streptomyces capoamus TaxID=68183 RepID=A0A919ET54_9ACTN|nr:sugar-binding domain-containing protein [Streptomyces capoamus]GGW12843.1 beta-mannosidase [Streptomyces libani subsp. rufus]GHG35579.1 beta-mannosidase [Streptomyces capoamus]